MTAQRPILSSDTATVPKGFLELESGITLGPGSQVDAPTALKLGTGPATEAFLLLAPYRRLEGPGENPEGFGDLHLGGRYRFRDDEGRRPSAALQAHIKLPTADEDEGLGSGEVDVALAGILTWHRDQSLWTAFYQMQSLGEPDGADMSHDAGLLAAFLPRHRLGGFAEIGANLVPEEDLDQIFATFGATYNPGNQLVWDIAVLVGLSEESPDWLVSFGFTKGLGPVGF